MIADHKILQLVRTVQSVVKKRFPMTFPFEVDIGQSARFNLGLEAQFGYDLDFASDQ